MAVLDVQVDGELKPLYMDGMLHNQLTTKVRSAVRKKDFDYVFAIDGEEGAGKSVFAFQVAKILDPDFDVSQIAFTADEFIKKVVNAKPFQCIVFDEAFTGLSSRAALSEVNQLLVALMMEMRQKNLFIILVMPSFFMLDKYAVLHRARCLIHVYMRNGKRGFWGLYNKNRMKYLYLKGKKYFDYSHQEPVIFGRFQNQYMINEEKYREVKKKALNKKKRTTRAEAYREQRDTLLYIMVKDLNLSQVHVSNLCKNRGFSIARNTISEIVHKRIRDLMADT